MCFVCSYSSRRANAVDRVCTEETVIQYRAHREQGSEYRNYYSETGPTDSQTETKEEHTEGTVSRVCSEVNDYLEPISQTKIASKETHLDSIRDRLVKHNYSGVCLQLSKWDSTCYVNECRGSGVQETHAPGVPDAHNVSWDFDCLRLLAATQEPDCSPDTESFFPTESSQLPDECSHIIICVYVATTLLVKLLTYINKTLLRCALIDPKGLHRKYMYNNIVRISCIVFFL